MTRSTLAAILGITLASILAACGGGESPGTGGEAGSASTTGSTTTTTPTGNGITYTKDAQPIYAKHCASCHTTGMSGGVNFASSYADSQKAPNAASCAGLSTVGACTIVRIKKGEMPFGEGCSGDPTKDATTPACLTQAEQDTIQAWIDGGQAQ